MRRSWSGSCTSRRRRADRPTEDVLALLGGLAHGPDDTLDVVDPAVPSDVLTVLIELLPELPDRLPSPEDSR